MRTKESIPNPSALLESMREIGYSTESAIADLIDNSITANSTNINIRFSWSDGNPWISIIDDGDGMDMDELLTAMQIGSSNPLDQRHPEDLGRFGLGLKTASLSQSRRFTVISKRKKIFNIAQWDLDSIDILKNNKWSINIPEKNEINPKLKALYGKYLEKNDSGTIVFWDSIDRIDVGEIPIKRKSNLIQF